MAATTYYVDANIATGTHDGSSWANAFASLSLAEAALDKDLDAAGEQMTILCSGTAGTSDTTYVSFGDWVCTVAGGGKLTIAAANEAGHYDRAISTGHDLTRYSRYVTDSTCISLLAGANNVVIDGLQIKITSVAGNVYCFGAAAAAAGNAITMSNCFLIASGASTSCLKLDDTDINFTCWNTIAMTPGSACYQCVNTTTANFYNCVAYGSAANGFRRTTAGTMTCTNCVSFKNVTDFNGTMTVDYCASDDGTGTHDVAESGGGAEWPSDFVDAANGNFTLLVGSGLKNTGTDNPGAGIYSDDINRDTRTSTWDVGADEYIAAAGGSIVPRAMHHYKMQRRGF